MIQHDIRRLRRQGYTWYEIANLFNMSELRLQIIRDKYGIEPMRT